ncbi:RagB/SusD family nutrient uptake outer membrane protein [Zunongwangia sp.]|uniref:RagB/SusD family nutrient uptake outer membrane protein n=1 Tax=Zunongwangia sp. TaxID=1965325 RepID=UPI003AA8BFA8
MKNRLHNTKRRNVFFRIYILIIGVCSTVILQSCEDEFLDVVPDNVATIDQAFNLRNEAEKYLFTCYSYMPRNGNLYHNPAMLAGDELWIPDQRQAVTIYSLDIAMGFQRVSNPYFNVWDGNYQGGGPDPNDDGKEDYPLFDGIRHCNIFIENMNDPDQVPDITSSERNRWIAEAKYLKAYYHFYLLRMYGPIPIMRENIPIDAPSEQLNVPREPFDEGVNYIVQLLDEAAEVLPTSIVDLNTELGRVTAPIAKGLKAKVLLTAASPLFNGNEDLSILINSSGEQLFNTAYDANKWKLAADAALDAIEAAEGAGSSLYEFPGSAFTLSDTTETKLSIRNAVTERWNSEIIWNNTLSTTTDLQRYSMAPLSLEHNHNDARKILSPTLKMARMFYSKNGVPINEDKTLDFTNFEELQEAGEEDRFNIKEGYKTSRLNFDREPRFYADLGFDGAIWYKYDAGSDDTKFHIESKYTDYAGSNHAFLFNVTGYFLKKLVNWNQSFSSSGATYRSYAWPELRLADLYLMYAEALNEVSGPSTAVYEYLDRIRTRAGLKGVQESWRDFSVNPDKPNTQSGLREIIHRERTIELAFEGNRYWDIRRWKTASQELNEPIRGWNVFGKDEVSYYQIRTLFQQRFVAPRDYFWPIAENALLQNSNLVQNPGW